MKTLFFILLAACPTVAAAQKPAPAAKADTVMLWSGVEGDYAVERYMVRRDSGQNADCVVHYLINSSSMSPSFDGNASELAELESLLGSFAKDTMVNVKSITVTGYASPDGRQVSNAALAKRRADDMMRYLDGKYALSTKYDVTVSSAVAPWSDCLRGLRSAGVQNYDSAAAAIGDGKTMAQTEARLRRMTGVWSTLRSTVLPSLRRVEVVIVYGRNTTGERRTLINKPAQPCPPVDMCPCGCGRPSGECCDMVVVEDTVNGIIVEMDSNLID